MKYHIPSTIFDSPSIVSLCIESVVILGISVDSFKIVIESIFVSIYLGNSFKIEGIFKIIDGELDVRLINNNDIINKELPDVILADCNLCYYWNSEMKEIANNDKEYNKKEAIIHLVNLKTFKQSSINVKMNFMKNNNYYDRDINNGIKISCHDNIIAIVFNNQLRLYNISNGF